MDRARMDMMAAAAAREIRDGDIVFCGTGISLLAAMTAKHVTAPGSVIVFETGPVDSVLEEIPMAVSDSRVLLGASAGTGMADAFALMQSRRFADRTVAILGAAQIDPYGNLNSTCIGPYARPDVRLAGSGGACDAASFASRVIVFMKHERRRFVEKLDYLTSPGWLGGPGERERAGLPPGGPAAVITDLCVLRFDGRTRRMTIGALHPGVTEAMVHERTGFALPETPDLKEAT